jgi:hypothetical protein
MSSESIRGIHVTSQDGPEAWIPVIKTIKDAQTEHFAYIITLHAGDGKPILHLSSEFLITLLEEYVKNHVGKSESPAK